MLLKRLTSGLILTFLAAIIIYVGDFWFNMSVFVLAAIAIGELYFMTRNQLKDNFLFILGAALIGIAYIASMYIRSRDNGFWLTLWFVLTVASVDTFAFFIGRAIGGPKLAPKISPNKTWSGLLGGIGVAVAVDAVGYILYYHSKINMFTSLGSSMAITAIIGFLAQVSDLSKSYVKRKCNAKDSSNLIPGHGGVLDRIDGYVLTAPVVAVLHLLH